MFGVQYTIGDIVGVDLVAVDSTTGSFSNQRMIDLLNNQTAGNTNYNSFSDLSNGTNQIITLDENAVTTNPIGEAARVALLLFQIITGTYIFTILTFFGVPAIFVAGITMIYVILLARTIIAYLRGIWEKRFGFKKARKIILYKFYGECIFFRITL